MKIEHDVVLNHLHFGANESKEAVVVLHGLFGSARNLSSLCRALAKTHQVYAFDLPCHGNSPAMDDMSFNNMAHAVLATVEALGLERIQLLGHSLGGKVAMALALAHPELVSRLVVADIAPVKYSPVHSLYLDAMLSLPSGTTSRQAADVHLAQWIDQPSLRQFLIQNLVKRDNEYVWRIPVQTIADQYDTLRDEIHPECATTFNAPTLFIRGAESDYIREAHREKIAQLFPHYELADIEGAGHWLHAEKPGEFNGLVSAFLDDPQSKSQIKA